MWTIHVNGLKVFDTHDHHAELERDKEIDEILGRISHVTQCVMREMDKYNLDVVTEEHGRAITEIE